MVEAANKVEDALKKLDTLDTNEASDSLNNSTVSSSGESTNSQAENPADFTEEEVKKAEEFKAQGNDLFKRMI